MNLAHSTDGRIEHLTRQLLEVSPSFILPSNPRLQLCRRQASPKHNVLTCCHEGLLFIHDSGIAHCDIKPNNLLINHRGLVLKIADFGIAMYVNVGPYIQVRVLPPSIMQA